MDNLNYGVVGNCRSAALVSQKGSIDWCCLPDFDSPSVFARLLDYEKGGNFSLEVDDSYTIRQKYINNTNVLRTSFSSPEGAFDIIDFMPRYQITDREFFRPAEIHRLIQHISGKPKVKIEYNPILNYARDPVAHVIQDDHIRTYSTDWPTDCIYLYSSFDLNDILVKNGHFISRMLYSA